MSFGYDYDDSPVKKYTEEQVDAKVDYAVASVTAKLTASKKPKQSPFVFESGEITAIHEAEVTDRAAYKIDLGPDERNRRAGSRNQKIVFPADDELQIDIDSEHAYEVFNAMRWIVSMHFPIESVEEHPSHSGLPKRHITVKMKEKVTNHERLLLQLALGSDRVREVLGLARLRLGQPNPTCLFEPKSEDECTTTENISPEPSNPSVENSKKGFAASLLSWLPGQGKP